AYDNAAAVAKTAHKQGCCKSKGFRHMPSDLYHVLHQRINMSGKVTSSQRVNNRSNRLRPRDYPA
ncbi:hypothetical protein Tco_1360740, partial [Tanacetum coccineum]